MKYFFTISLCVLGIFFTKRAIKESPEIKFIKNLKVSIVPPKNIEYFHFGFNENLADLFWIRWIQDFQYCGKGKVENKIYTEKQRSLKEKAHKRDLANSRPKDFKDSYLSDRDYKISTKDVCNQSWSFAFLNAVTKLSPKFRMPYAVGATSLSVLTFDIEGASVIFKRGIKNFPKDWSILYRAAYHFLYEFNDYEIAADLFSRAQEAGAPDWVQSLASRLYKKAGKYEIALVSLEKYYQEIKSKDLEVAKLVKKRILSLRTLHDKALNQSD